MAKASINPRELVHLEELRFKYLGRFNFLSPKEQEEAELNYLAGILVQIYLDQKEDELKKPFLEDL